jgi:hypothetical protein
MVVFSKPRRSRGTIWGTKIRDVECYAVCVGVLTGMRYVSSTPKVGGNSSQGSLAGTLGILWSSSHLDFAVADNPKPAGLARPLARGARPITPPEICRAAGEQSVSSPYSVTQLCLRNGSCCPKCVLRDHSAEPPNRVARRHSSSALPSPCLRLKSHSRGRAVDGSAYLDFPDWVYASHAIFRRGGRIYGR